MKIITLLFLLNLYWENLMFLLSRIKMHSGSYSALKQALAAGRSSRNNDG